jgi:hypothetical protein
MCFVSLFLILFEGKGSVCDILSGLIWFRLENEANLAMLILVLRD